MEADPTPTAPGVISEFRGPYAGGAPAAALTVVAPDLDRFGLRELGRMVSIGVAILLQVYLAVAVWLLRRRRRSLAAAASEGLVSAFEVLGPTFVKLGQLIASSPGIFPTSLADACLRCLDEVRPFDAEAVRRLVTEDLGHSPASLFRSFDPTPLSAASIAQVHACVLPDGREAVLKLQRPGIAARMNSDLRILHVFAKALARTKLGQRANTVAIIEDLHEVTNQELNFALEAHRQSRFRTNISAFGDNKHITAPEVYWEYCAPRIVCMERMSGVPMDQFDVLRARGVDGELILRRGIKVWMEAAMVHGPFHGDVHAGNLWVLDDGRASYLDFGIMGELTDEWKGVLRDIFRTSMLDGDYARLVRAYKRVGILPPGVGDAPGEDEQIGAMIKMVMDPMLDRGIGEVSLGEALGSSMQLAEQFGATSPKELVLISKQLLYFERYAKELAPSYVLARDVYLVKNVFPAEVAAKVESEGWILPD